MLHARARWAPRALVLAVALFVAARPARALDARSVGMGNTGTAFVADGAALYFNPALLHQTGELAATVIVAPIATTLETPIAGPNTGFASATSPLPLFLVGGNLRLTDRLVLGAAAYPVAGFGATYRHVLNGPDVTLTAVAIESSTGASFALTKDLAIGVGYRATYTALRTGMPLLSTYQEQNVSGFNFLGARAGVFYRPIPALRLGLAYQSKTATQLVCSRVMRSSPQARRQEGFGRGSPFAA
jgi:long-subunit fatty acid transport protein